MRRELLMRGCSILGPVLLGAAVSISFDDSDQSALVYVLLYGGGSLLLGASLVLWLKPHAQPSTEEEKAKYWVRHPLASLLGTFALAGALGLIGGLFIAPGEESGEDPCFPQTLTRLSGPDMAAQRMPPSRAGAARAKEPIPMRENPRSLAVGSEGVWVTQDNDESVALIDPKQNHSVGAPIRVGEDPFSIALAEDVAWVTREDGWVVAIDRDTRKIVRQYEYGSTEGEVALGAGSVWVNNYDEQGPGVITRIDPCTHEIAHIRLGERARTVRFAFGSVWVSDPKHVLLRFDPATGKVKRIPLPATADPQDIGAGGGFVWAVSFESQELYKVDPRKNRVVGDPIPIGQGAAGIVVAAGAVWLPNSEGNSVTRVDLRTSRSEPEAVEDVGGTPTDIAAGFGRVWVPNYTSEFPTVTPIEP
ncbi:MAG TPA: hypothetical protein VN733_07060 [Solirubrobacterales bacterium]|nr:hypothetical protein [Solirubrobacterales bacterium]